MIFPPFNFALPFSSYDSMGYFLIKGKDGKLSVKQRFAFLVSCSHSTCPPMLWYPMNLASGCLPSKGLFQSPYSWMACPLQFIIATSDFEIMYLSPGCCDIQGAIVAARVSAPPNLASLCLAADSMFTFITRACLAPSQDGVKRPRNPPGIMSLCLTWLKRAFPIAVTYFPAALQADRFYDKKNGTF